MKDTIGFDLPEKLTPDKAYQILIDRGIESSWASIVKEYFEWQAETGKICPREYHEQSSRAKANYEITTSTTLRDKQVAVEIRKLIDLIQKDVYGDDRVGVNDSHSKANKLKKAHQDKATALIDKIKGSDDDIAHKSMAMMEAMIRGNLEISARMVILMNKLTDGQKFISDQIHAHLTKSEASQ